MGPRDWEQGKEQMNEQERREKEQGPSFLTTAVTELSQQTVQGGLCTPSCLPASLYLVPIGPVVW